MGFTLKKQLFKVKLTKFWLALLEMLYINLMLTHQIYKKNNNNKSSICTPLAELKIRISCITIIDHICFSKNPR